MGLKERFYDRLGFKRESTINSMKANLTLKNGDIVKVAETGYFYDIKESSTSIPLNNGLFAEVKQTTFLQIVTNCVNKLNEYITNLSSLIQQFNTHKGTMASTSENGHMSASDKSKLDGIANNANNYILPKATANILGGIIVGDNLTVDDNGRLNAMAGGIQDIRYTAMVMRRQWERNDGVSVEFGSGILVTACTYGEGPNIAAQNTRQLQILKDGTWYTVGY